MTLKIFNSLKYLILLGVLMAIVPVSLNAQLFNTVYVSPLGNDSWEGTIIKPFKTIDKAVVYIRNYKITTGHANVIILKPGTYFLNKPIILDSLCNNLIIKGNKSTKPIIYGGRQIQGWKKEGHFLVADVPNMDFRLLEVNGRFAERSRLPESGTFENLSVFKSNWSSTAEGGFDVKPTKEQLQTMIYKQKDFENIYDAENLEVTLFSMWIETLLRIDSIDRTKNKITFSQSPDYPAGAFRVNKYIVWNSKTGMKRPGQWYLDSKKGKVYYWPLKREKISTIKAVVPTQNELIRIDKAKNITIKNIGFRSNNSPLMRGGFGAKAFSAAILVTNAKRIVLDSLSISNLSTHGIKANKVKDFTLSNCNIHHTGASGIILSGENSTIYNNNIHDIGLLYPSSIAVNVASQKSNKDDSKEAVNNNFIITIDHNNIFNTSYSAISCTGSKILISNNRIYKAMQVLADGAGIYISGGKENMIRGNYVSDIPQVYGSGSSAYYLDELTENTIVEKNLSINVNRPILTHMDENNSILNNVFIVENGNGEVFFSRSKNLIFKNNVFITQDTIKVKGVNAINELSNNIFYNPSKNVVLYDYDVKKRALLNKHSVKDGFKGIAIIPPNILSYKRGKISYSKNASSKRTEVEPINVSGAGIIKRK